MHRRTFLQLLACVAALRPGAAAAQTSAPTIPVRELYARITISGADIIASRDCPPGQLWGLAAADWINDGTYRVPYLGIDRSRFPVLR